MRPVPVGAVGVHGQLAYTATRTLLRARRCARPAGADRCTL